jgi:hypothetical protein
MIGQSKRSACTPTTRAGSRLSRGDGGTCGLPSRRGQPEEFLNWHKGAWRHRVAARRRRRHACASPPNAQFCFN